MFLAYIYKKGLVKKRADNPDAMENERVKGVGNEDV
jgi:hypothetical protein